MGAFSLCVETTARDVNALLALHKVHPQVRADVKRRLNLLVEKSYEQMTVLRPGYAESSYQVCHAIASDIVKRTLEVAIPTSELAAEEKKCAGLYQEVQDLTAELGQLKECFATSEVVMTDLKNAHDYMLHSYFREVLILRQQLCGAQRHSAANSKRSVNLSTTLPSSHRSSSVRNTAVAAAATEATKRNQRQAAAEPASPNAQLGGSDVFSSPMNPILPEAAGTGFYFGDVLLQKERGTGVAEVSTTNSHVNVGVGGNPTLDTSAGTQQVQQQHQQQQQGISMGLLGRSTQDGAGVAAAATKEGPDDVSVFMANETPTVAAATPQADFDSGEGKKARQSFNAYRNASVDAIFDYERYIQLLNGRQGDWDSRYSEVEAQKRELKKLLQRERSRARVGLKLMNETHSETVDVLQHKLSLERERNNKFWWLFHLAMEPIQEGLQEDVEELRTQIKQMQAEHNKFAFSVQAGLNQMQHRSDAIMDFFLTYIQSTREILASIKLDATARSKHELLLHSALPNAGVLIGFLRNSSRESCRFKPLAKLEAEGPLDASDLSLTYNTDGLDYWIDHPITKLARETYADLHALAGKLRSRRALQLQTEVRLRSRRKQAPGTTNTNITFVGVGGRGGQDGVPDFFCGDSSTNSADGSRGKGTLDPSWKTSVVEGTGGMTAEDVLKELVALRKHRLVNRARHRTGFRLLRQATMADGSLSAGSEGNLHGSDSFSAGNGAESQRGSNCSSSDAALRRQSTANSTSLADSAVELDVRVAMISNARDMAEKSMERDTKRIEELLRLLALHMDAFRVISADGEEEEVDEEGGEAEEQRRAREQSEAERRLLELLNSPYWLAPPGKYSGLGHSSGLFDGRTYYIPVGLPGVSSDFPGYITFKDERIPLSAFFNDPRRFGASKEEEDEVAFAKQYGLIRTNIPRGALKKGQTRTPYAAVMEYCRGVQRGLPLGDNYGPVYLEYDEVTDEYYVADAAGRRLPLDEDTAKAEQHMSNLAAAVNNGYYVGNARSAMPMTQILFPAPAPPSLQGTQETDMADAAASGAYVYCYAPGGNTSGEGQQTSGGPPTLGLRPMYLVPMTVPVPVGTHPTHPSNNPRTAESVLYHPGPSIPLSVSCRQLLGTKPLQPPSSRTATVSTSNAVSGRSISSYIASNNPYISAIPRVCRPDSGMASLFSIKAFPVPKDDQQPQPPQQEQGAMEWPTTFSGRYYLSGRSESASDENYNLYGVSGGDEADARVLADPQPILTTYGAVPSGSTLAEDTLLSDFSGASPGVATSISGGCGGGGSYVEAPGSQHITPSGPQPLHGGAGAGAMTTQTILARAKMERAARLERERERDQLERDQRREEWVRGREVPEPTLKERFLRTRLPRLNPITHTPSALPAPLEAARLQQRIRPPQISLKENGDGGSGTGSNNSRALSATPSGNGIVSPVLPGRGMLADTVRTEQIGRMPEVSLRKPLSTTR